ncbi:MAG TPA: glycosyltransferase family A protein [Gaiellaceae bacterium]|nr:glycosyltransferase family A protein [Gaiellaceae bacterium]
MTQPLISVMIGVYNAERYLAEAIESVFAQSYRPLELVVVDDGSDDGSGDVARGYGERLTYARQENGGNGSARNHAVRLAAGELFAFLDADDRFVPGKLEQQFAALQADPSLDMVFGHVREFVSPELTEAQCASVRPPAAQPQPWPAPNLMLIRRDSFARVGPFSEDVRVGVTVDWYARAMEAGLRGAVLPEVVLERRLHLTNNGLRERDSRQQYLHVLKASLDRRRAQAASDSSDASPVGGGDLHP